MRTIVVVAFTVGLSGLALGADGALPGQPLDENKELEAMQKEVAEFDDAQKDYRTTVRHVVQQEYSEKRKSLTGKYQAQIDVEDKEERLRRSAAIVLFENFLGKYSHDDRWTPDAMFRLAELYFEKNNDEYLIATQNGSAGITADYQKTIDIYKDLIARFPNYRLIDGAYYLMGYCLKEMTRDGESLQAFRALVCKNKYGALDAPPPGADEQSKAGSKESEKDAEAVYNTCEPVKADSRFIPEAWIRIGEYHFDRASEIRNNVAEQNKELGRAEAAYTRVLAKDSPLYDKALYKLAWSFYRHDKYLQGVKAFDELVVYSDKKRTDTGKEGSDLRVESVQYLGVSFSENDWNDHINLESESSPLRGLERIEQFYRGRYSEGHVKEIYAKLGDVYFDKADFPHAINAYKKTIERWPNDPDGPKLQDRIVRIYETLHNEKMAFQEREKLVANYTNEKGDWFKNNRDNKAAIDTANELAEFTLQKVAADYQNDALDRRKKLPPLPKRDDPRYKDARRQRNATEAYRIVKEEYAKAAAAWEVYLAKYPNSKESYEYSYAYAEALYYAERYQEAAKQYELVRDSRLDNKYAEDSAFSVTKAYEELLDDQAEKRKVVWPQPQPDKNLKPPITPIPYPELVEKLQQSYDIFVQRVPKAPRVPSMSYKAAELAYNYLHWDDMRTRMGVLLDKYCKDEIGANAGKAILNSFTIENNLDKVAEFAETLQKKQCGTAATVAETAQALGKTIASAKFNKAEKLFNEGKCEDAAPLYEAIVSANPKDPQADAALNNAALCYGRVHRPGKAKEVYQRIVDEYPNSKFVDEALYLVAASSQKAFDFDGAVKGFQRLAEEKRFSGSKFHFDALYAAANILEFDQNYGKAAELYKKYAVEKANDHSPPKVLKAGELPPASPADAVYSAALCYQKMKDGDSALKTFREYLSKYSPGLKRTLEVNFKMAEIFEAKKDRRGADEQYKKIVAMGKSASPSSDEAEYPAHAEFILTEERLPDLEKMKVSQNPKQVIPSLQKLQDEAGKLYTSYQKVTDYKRATWYVAGLYRLGYIREFVSKSLRGILSYPCPADIQKQFKQEGCDAYAKQMSDQIEPQVTDVDKLAVQDYGETLKIAGALGVNNEWTRQARLHASAFDPEKFPLTKDEHIQWEAP